MTTQAAVCDEFDETDLAQLSQLYEDLQQELQSKNLEIVTLKRDVKQREASTKALVTAAMAQHEAANRTVIQDVQAECDNLRRRNSSLQRMNQDLGHDIEEQKEQLKFQSQKIKLLQTLADKKAPPKEQPGRAADDHDRTVRGLQALVKGLEYERTELSSTVADLRKQLLQVPQLQEELEETRKQAHSAEYANNELMHAVTTLQDEVATLRKDLASQRPPSVSMDAPATPVKLPAGDGPGYEDEPSLGDMADFLELGGDDLGGSSVILGDEVDSVFSEDSIELRDLQAKLQLSTDTLEEKQAIIDHLQEAQAAMVTSSHRMQREMADLRKKLYAQQMKAETAMATAEAATRAAASREHLKAVPAHASEVADSPTEALTLSPSPPPLRPRHAPSNSEFTFNAVLDVVNSEMDRTLHTDDEAASRLHQAQVRSEAEIQLLVEENDRLRAELRDEGAASKNMATAVLLENGTLIVPDGSFVDGYRENDSVKRVTLGSRVTVAPLSFKNCPNLETVVAGGNAVIGKSCFSDCPKLGSVTLGERAEARDEAFSRCPALTAVALGPNPQLGKGLPNTFYQQSKAQAQDATIKQLRVELAAMLKVIHTCPVAKILAREQAKKKEKEKKRLAKLAKEQAKAKKQKKKQRKAGKQLAKGSRTSRTKEAKGKRARAAAALQYADSESKSATNNAPAHQHQHTGHCHHGHGDHPHEYEHSESKGSTPPFPARATGSELPPPPHAHDDPDAPLHLLEQHMRFMKVRTRSVHWARRESETPAEDDNESEGGVTPTGAVGGGQKAATNDADQTEPGPQQGDPEADAQVEAEAKLELEPDVGADKVLEPDAPQTLPLPQWQLFLQKLGKGKEPVPETGSQSMASLAQALRQRSTAALASADTSNSRSMAKAHNAIAAQRPPVEKFKEQVQKKSILHRNAAGQRAWTRNRKSAPPE